ncbi:MAG: AI-2E family transporter [Oscillospiraceae bacterium]|nr:AI-2E family transporter [Oscillospiraceae bacterium]
MERFSKQGLTRWIGIFLLAIAVIAVYKAFDSLGFILDWLRFFISILTPFIAAFAIAYFLNKPASKLERLIKRSKLKNTKFIYKRARALSVFAVYIIVIAVIYLALSQLIPLLVGGIANLVEQLPVYGDRFVKIYNDFIEGHSYLKDMEITSRAITMLNNYLDSISSADIGQYAKQLAGLGNVLINILLSIVISIYMLLEKEALISVLYRFLSLFLKDKTIGNISNYVHQTDHVVYHYFVGQFFDCVIVSALATIVLSVLNAPYALVLGLIFGMFNIIPYFGPIISGVVVILIIFVADVEHNVWLTLWCAVALLVIQQIDANIINPKILGDALDMSPFWVLFAVTVGGGMFGFVGMLVGVPCVAVLRLFFRDFVLYRKEKKERQALENSQSEI